MIERSMILDFHAEQLFDIAADIEHYPQFVPGWTSARIVERHGDTLNVEQVVGFGPACLEFYSTAVLSRPKRLEIRSTDMPFERLSLLWLFTTLPLRGCLVRLAADFVLRSAILQSVLDHTLPGMIDGVILAFSRRAASLYPEKIISDISPNH
jgi:coenzyme Q-binding protein COQ10